MQKVECMPFELVGKKHFEVFILLFAHRLSDPTLFPQKNYNVSKLYKLDLTECCGYKCSSV